ncbi:MAG: hypothetical protein ACLSB9_14715 [Hydrogeniiclostridium mannosilyticum]
MKKEAKQKQPPKERPRYNLWQNTAYMAGLAWQEQKSVLALCLLQALFFVGLNLVNLFIAPSILGAVEDRVPLEGVLGTIAFFVLVLLVLNILKTWVATNTLFGRIAVRLKILAEINKKFARTSYPNTEDPAVLKKGTRRAKRLEEIPRQQRPYGTRWRSCCKARRALSFICCCSPR